MLARLPASGPAGQRLTTRHDDDFAIGLLDAWATVADVLTFYHERIANESYLRTATERLSVQALARLIGYELQPGVAASTCVAFTLDAATSVQLIPDTTTGGQADMPGVSIPPQTKVQSIPGPGEDAQTFETVETIVARPDWNAMKPRPTQPQPLDVNMNQLLLTGTAYALKPGDVILLTTGTTEGNRKLRKIRTVTTDEAAKTTRLDLVVETTAPTYVRPALPLVSAFSSAGLLFNQVFNAPMMAMVVGQRWRGGDFAAAIAANHWSLRILTTSLAQPPTKPPPPAATLPNSAFVFRKRAFIFGYNAPPKITYTDSVPSVSEWQLNEARDTIYLDAAYDELMPGGVVAIQKGNEKLEEIPITAIISVDNVTIRSRTEYGMSGKTTALTVASDWLLAPAAALTTHADLRNRTVYAQSEPLSLAEIPITDTITGDTITLDRYYPGLEPGRKLILTGMRADLPGVAASDLMTIKETIVAGGLTELVLEQSLTYEFVRTSVIINGNVALATQGETVRESLGSGDAAKIFQRFVLRQPPLTYVGGGSASGAVSTLDIRVNDLRWREIPSLLDAGPQDRVFVTRLDDAGRTTVLFGDGVTGARLPTGTENIKATYRKGMGVGGLVKANQLSQLINRPSGVKGVNNPLPATGAADRETIDAARQNAPLPVLTLGRIVSGQDYADFARSFAGVAKTLATRTWLGQRQGVFLTVAGVNGAAIDPGDDLYKNLLAAIRRAGDPNVAFRVGTYAPVFFQVTASLRLHPDYDPANVLPTVERALRQQFSFAARDFGQAVAYSEVVTAMQRVAGVVAVDLDTFFRTDETIPATLAETPRLLEARAPRPGADASTVLPAELLTLDPRPVTLREMP